MTEKCLANWGRFKTGIRHRYEAMKKQYPYALRRSSAMVGDESVESRRERARDLNTSPEAIEELVADGDRSVRSEVATNP